MNKDQKILVVAESIDVNDSSGTKGRVAFIRNLNSIGLNPTVLHYTRRTIEIDGVECIAINELKFNAYYILSRLRRIINRYLKIDIFKYIDVVLGNSFTFFNDSKSISRVIEEYGDKFDYIFTFSKGTSYRTHNAMLKCPELHGKWIAYIHDPYPYHCFPEPYRYFQKGYKQKERFFLNVSEMAQYSIFPSKLLVDWMSKFFPNFKNTAVIIPHQHLSSEITELELDFFDLTKFNLLHAGNLLEQRNPHGLLEGFKLFLENNPLAKNKSSLIMVGHHNCHKELLQEYNSLIPELYVHDGNVPYDTAAYLQKACWVNIILEAKADISPFLPGKFPHCVFANKPILYLGPNNSEVVRILGTEYTYKCDVDQVEIIAEKLEILFNKWIENDSRLFLNRRDVENYLELDYFRSQINNIQ